MTISAKVIQASRHALTGTVGWTFEVVFPNIILAEVLTHRVFSRNTSSSRALPIEKVISAVINDPFVPAYVGANKKGMQAGEELTGWRRNAFNFVWHSAKWAAIGATWALSKLGVHKQVANRLLHPFMHTRMVITTTDLNNFFHLRYHPDAEPHIRDLAITMYNAFLMYPENEIEIIDVGEWHVPYIERTRTEDGTLIYFDDDDPFKSSLTEAEAKAISAARCASTSYKTVDGKTMTLDRALDLADKLIKADVVHASPFEHIFTVFKKLKPKQKSNLRDFLQYRKTLPNESVPG